MRDREASRQIIWTRSINLLLISIFVAGLWTQNWQNMRATIEIFREMSFSENIGAQRCKRKETQPTRRFYRPAGKIPASCDKFDSIFWKRVKTVVHANGDDTTPTWASGFIDSINENFRIWARCRRTKRGVLQSDNLVGRKIAEARDHMDGVQAFLVGKHVHDIFAQ